MNQKIRENKRSSYKAKAELYEKKKMALFFTNLWKKFNVPKKADVSYLQLFPLQL